MDTPFRLTLASGSVGRRYLMERAGYTFAIVPADVDEPTTVPAGDIRRFVQEVAWMKANAVAPRVADGVIIAADTVAWLEGELLLKPTDAADARRILRTLAGREHELWTGVTLWRKADDLQLCWQERSLVHMRPLTDAELDAYIATNEWVGCSGGYALKEPSDPFLTVTHGSTANVIGLPIETLGRVLVPFGTLAQP
jgi:septum formation protein